MPPELLRADPAVVGPLHQWIMRAVAEAHSEYGDIDLRLEGGTALAAYHLSHRQSEDLDFFAHRAMDARDFSSFVSGRFVEQGRSVETLRANRGFAAIMVTGLEAIDSAVKVEFGQTSPFELAPPDRTREGISVASYRDLCAGKLHAICDRYEPKDFIDLHVILQRPFGAREPSHTDVSGRFRDLLADLERSDPGLGPLRVGEALARGMDRKVLTEFPLRLLVSISDDELQETIRLAVDECARIARERGGWSAV